MSVEKPTLNKCLNHKDQPADFVCTVCYKYFCSQCVSVRDYTGYICHECSGEKVSEPVVEAEAESPDKQAAPKPKKAAPQRITAPQEKSASLMAPGIEWAIIGVCVVLAGARLFTSFGGSEEPLQLESNAPEDISVYCLGILDEMEYQGAKPDLLDIKSACPYPVEVEEVSTGFLVTAPDPYVYGFGEIEITLAPMTLTITEE
ncbi:MAG: hypothetical protein AAGG55_16810 [Pseudomonadota bacterium]